MKLASFVLESVKPSHLGRSEIGSEQTAIARPSFTENSGAWTEALRIAETIGCALPFVASVRRAGWFGEIPEKVRLQLEERLQRERVLQAVLDSELDSVLFLLIGAKLPVMILGGMDLGRRFYPDRVLRPVSELELLVPVGAYSDALRALGRGGYRGIEEGDRRGLRLARKTPGPVIFLRRFIEGRETENAMAALWDRSREGRIAGLPRNARSLSSEDNLVELIRKGTSSRAEQSPIWLNDMHFLVTGSEFASEGDWDQVIWHLAQERSISATWFILKTLSEEWGTPVPQAILRECGRRLSPLRRGLLSRMTDPHEWFGAEGESNRIFRSRLLLKDSVIQAIRNTPPPGVQPLKL